MALSTNSVFYFDFQIDQDNRFLCIDEGAGEVIIELESGSFSFTEMAVMLQTAFNAVPLNSYAVNVDRNDRTFQIVGSAPFDILISSGSLGANQAWSQIGFTGAVDLTGSASYTGNASVGKEYVPQFWLQDYVPSTNFRKASEATVRKTATGKVEVVTFGTERFMKCSIRFATNLPMDGTIIRSNPTGYQDLQTFMVFLITKAPIEFMQDINDRATFETMILEKTEQDSNGIAFELKELYAQGLHDFYDAANLTFRVIE